MNDHLIKACDDVLRNIDRTRINIDSYSAAAMNMETALSIESLNKIQENNKDVTNARNLKNNDNRISFDFGEPLLGLLELVEMEIGHTSRSSGFFKYPPGGYCGWHTNSNTKSNRPNRLYFTWAQEDNKSFFRYKDNSTGEIKTNYDTKGWQMRKFKLSTDEESLYWHCVGSQTNRVSIGFAY